MTSERLLNMSIDVLYIPQKFIPPKTNFWLRPWIHPRSNSNCQHINHYTTLPCLVCPIHSVCVCGLCVWSVWYPEYEVVTVTGDARGAGTNANVFITIFGKTGQTPKLQLRSSSGNDVFKRSQSDIFLLNTKCVGPLKKIR